MELSDAIEKIRPSISQVLVVGAADHSHHVVGTAFIVHDKGYAITAKHVTQGAVQLLSAMPGAELMLGLALPNLDGPVRLRASFELVRCEVVEEDPRHDLALLRLEPNPFATGRASGVNRMPDGGFSVSALFGLAHLKMGRPRDGEQVAVSGYPLGEAVLVTNAGHIASAWASDVQEVQLQGAPAGFTAQDVADSYLADLAVNPGNSGGPVYAVETGEVIGVCVAFRAAPGLGGNPFASNSGLSIVVPIRYTQELVARHT